MLCPKCKSGHAHRSHRRGWWEYFASCFAYYPYRCRDCAHRFMHFRYAAHHTNPAANSTGREIRSTRSQREWERKRRELLLYGGAALLFWILWSFIICERNSSSGGN